MGDEAKIGVSIEATNNTAGGIKEAAKSVKEGAAEIAGAFKEAGAGAEESGNAIGKLSEVLREHKSEHVQAARSARFFTSEIAELTGKGSEASVVLGKLAGGLAAGGLVGVAFAGATTAAHLLKAKFDELQEEMVGPFTRGVKAGEIALKSMDDTIRSIAKETENLTDKVRFYGMTATQVASAQTQLAILSHQDGIERDKGEIESTEKTIEAQKKKLEAMKSWTNSAKEYAQSLVNPFGAVTDALERRATIESLEKEIQLNEQEVQRWKNEAKIVEQLDKKADALTKIEGLEQGTKSKKAEDKEDNIAEKRQARADAFMEETLKKQKEREDAFGEKRAETILSLENRIETTKSQIAADEEKMRNEREIAAENAKAAKIQSINKSTAVVVGAAFGAAGDQIGKAFDKGTFRAMTLKGFMEDFTKSALRNFEQIIIKKAEEAVVGHIASAIASTADVGHEAAVAGAATTASIAATGPVGVAAAPAAGAAMMAEVLATFGPMAAAAKGFDVPAGLNPYTHLHEQEMVLPADIAGPLRESLRGGGGIGETHNHYWQALDAESLRAFLSSPKFATAWREATRNGAIR